MALQDGPEAASLKSPLDAADKPAPPTLSHNARGDGPALLPAARSVY
jgi:hypothetical protein